MEIKDVLLIGLSIMAGTLLGKHIHSRLGKSKDGDTGFKASLIPYAAVECNVRIPASAIYDDSKRNTSKGDEKRKKKPNKFNKLSK